MMRNLIVLGCAGLLAIGLSLTGYAGVGADLDSDGVPDLHDNCVTTPNGPLSATADCDAQEDGDLDGYGNPCDSDINNNLFTDLPDVFAVFDAAVGGNTDLNFDLNCNGFAGNPDIFRAFDDSVTRAQPGPSGWACASFPPCP